VGGDSIIFMSKPSDLITDCVTGNLSHTKLWTHIAYFSATVAFLRPVIIDGVIPPVEFWFVYLGVVGGHNIWSRYLSIKSAAINKEEANG
jgi:hypothetical protein